MIEDANTGIRAKLLESGTITAACVARIYYGLAPLGATLPYIVFEHTGGGMDNDTLLESADITYTIKAIDESGENALNLQEAIRSVLHEASLTVGGGWSAFRCQQQEAILYSENDKKRTYWHAGGIYRVRLSK